MRRCASFTSRSSLARFGTLPRRPGRARQSARVKQSPPPLLWYGATRVDRTY
jgi:hypothetical protein